MSDGLMKALKAGVLGDFGVCRQVTVRCPKDEIRMPCQRCGQEMVVYSQEYGNGAQGCVEAIYHNSCEHCLNTYSFQVVY